MIKYKIIALIGMAGSGKDTLMQAMLSAYPTIFHEVIGCTTRPPREGEIDGVNYHFLTEAEFFDKCVANEVLESCWFNNWQYGTLKSALSAERVNIGVFSPEGIRNLLKCPEIDLKVLWVKASNRQRLIRQLNRELDPNIDEIIRRYEADKEDFSNINFDYIPIPNSNATDLVVASSVIIGTIGRAHWLKGKNN